MNSVSTLFVEATDGISHILCERGLSNDLVDQLPEVFPHELDIIERRQFVKVLQLHREILLPVSKAEGIDNIIQKFLQFL